jgi:hypothetical protein
VLILYDYNMKLKLILTGYLNISVKFVTVLLLTTVISSFEQAPKEKGIRLVRSDDKEKVDVFVNGSFFTSYRYPSDFEKPYLFPVMAPNGSVITRGYPVEPRKGERVDHPHHTGLWFNYGNVNGLDFWNNSSAIAADKKDGYGRIVHQKIVKAESGKQGLLEVEMNWNDNKGNTILKEHTKYIFSGDAESWTIDHISTLTAVNGQVILGDSKEGMFAIRVDRAFEMPSNESLIFTDDKGNPTTVKATDNTGVTGMYTSGQGLKGDAVWGTRNDWVVLTGTRDNTTISFGIFDNPKNTGYPAYAHARGYGLFAVNNLGRNSYDPKQEKSSLTLEKGQSITLMHRFCVKSGTEITSAEANRIFKEFSKAY